MRSGVWVAAAGVALAGCSSSGHPAAQGRPTSSQSASPSPAPTTPSASPSATTPSPRPSGPPAPTGFRATDVTFVSPDAGWAIGSGGIVHTTDGGDTWTRLPTPLDGVRNLRFASTTTGYAWRPQHRLWLTTDGGTTWRPAGLGAVDTLEIAGGNVWAFVAPEPYPTVWHSSVGSTAWRKLGMTPDRGDTLDVRGSLAYVTGQQGAGPVAPSLDVWSADGSRRHEELPCVGHRRLVAWSPLGVSTDGSLVLDCDVQRPHREFQLFYTSIDEGRSWTQVAAPPKAPDDVTAVNAGRFAFGYGIFTDRGAGWQQVLPSTRARHFLVAGFQDDSHGIALTSRGVLYRTTDAGHTWQAVRF